MVLCIRSLPMPTMPSSAGIKMTEGSEKQVAVIPKQKRPVRKYLCSILISVAVAVIAILAICGVLFSKFPEKKEVGSSSVQELNESKPHGGKDNRSNVRGNSADKPTSSQTNNEQGETSTPSSVEPSNNNSSPTGSQSSNSQSSQQEQTSPNPQPSNLTQSSNTQTGQSGVASMVENAFKNKKKPVEDGAVQSEEEKVQSVSKK